MPTQNVHKSDSIFKTISGSPRRESEPGPTPAPAAKVDPQPAAPVVEPGQSQPGPTAQAAPQEPQVIVTPPQEVIPAGPKKIVVDDPDAIIVNAKGEEIRLKDAEYYGFSRAKQLQEENRVASARKQVETLAGKLNTKLSDPVIKDYLYLSEAHPEWSTEEVRDAALRANGKESVLQRAPDEPVETAPEPPEGAVPGDKEWNEWLAKVSSFGAEQAVKKHVAPLLAAEQNRVQEAKRMQQSDRIATENLNLIQNGTQQFTHVDLAGLSKEENDAFYGRVGEVLAKRGLAFDDKSSRWNTQNGAIDENVYAFAVEAAWPEGSSPKKTPAPAAQTPAEIVSHHLNTGLGLVPDHKPQPSPQPPSAAMPVRTPMKNPGAGRKSDNPLRDFMQTGSVKGLN